MGAGEGEGIGRERERERGRKLLDKERKKKERDGVKKNKKNYGDNLLSIWVSLAFSALAVANQPRKDPF